MIQIRRSLTLRALLLTVGLFQPAVYGDTLAEADTEATAKVTQVTFTIKGMK